jgi:hypothetical protein
VRRRALLRGFARGELLVAVDARDILGGNNQGFSLDAPVRIGGAGAHFAVLFQSRRQLSTKRVECVNEVSARSWFPGLNVRYTEPARNRLPALEHLLLAVIGCPGRHRYPTNIRPIFYWSLSDMDVRLWPGPAPRDLAGSGPPVGAW